MSEVTRLYLRSMLIYLQEVSLVMMRLGVMTRIVMIPTLHKKNLPQNLFWGEYIENIR